MKITGVLLAGVMALACAQAPASWRDPSSHKVEFVTVEEGVQLEVLDWGGSGRPIVLLAGSGNTAHVFDGFAEKLLGSAHVYGITRRGYGLSSHPDSGYTEQRLAEDVLRVLDSLKIVAPVLVGHSMAGEEMTRLGAEHSDRLSGLVYLDAAADPTDRPASSPAYMEAHDKLLERMRKLPSPTAADRTSFAAYNAFWAGTEVPLPESELRNEYDAKPDGSVGRFRTSSRIHEAVGAGAQKRDYSAITVPILAFFTGPCAAYSDGDHACLEHGAHRPAYEPKGDEERAAIAAHDVALGVYFDRWKKQLRTAKAPVRIVDVPGANHYVFFSHEADVLLEVRAFVALLR